ncbi:precorrin-6y C5,15-methyltransferase (decarboxylating) subunit CbiE [Streptomyces agglomeratus]|uniref:Precorrin-6y C5,15-methyltransferase (Decarboxylating) subunit CbiE n=1 Tax=Streptomyces agglomeratus TaxID=285458 RepID=A0A1E5PE29_9ACTN|nr:precorrin-6y C5,15-methyltransferase (decarboxylating) subunit CbiE [Streptomyces agglomeratus]OEJ27792.1 precorrin-6y C5,15-methyltransferase (decarboxylating) subunit CbiE [Streptomyces agglomeratus]OEJ38148.1 precorrin-6y C5,15-methyltransferase (decarboxylating) subunit CbiE [Streptomyces agglomeratus]OEJ47468.1 precorrin-6y C5,15-methyltransferase (decarboxylating) subunit CbiE [Streptomyces agglomeratus]OEJ50675.1 precorrin-6y C5,15-methyltransferase (decarboxylating) subunit CbiE [Str
MADRVTVIGWDGSPLTAAARSALGAATLVAGAAHHLALPEVPPGAERIRLGSVDLAARRIAGHRGTAVVLADGDPGFFGVVRTLRAPQHGLEVEVVPAVSPVATAFARAGMPWDDAQVVVAHSRTLRRAVNVCRAHTKVAVLTSPGAGPAELALLLEGVHRTFVICEELGTAREQVTVLTSDKAADHTWRDPNVVIVIGGSAGPVSAVGLGGPAGPGGPGGGWISGHDPGYPPAVRGWALPAAEYGDGDGPDERPGDTREGEYAGLRAAQLARLGPRTGDLVWDIGSGSGALAVEAARFGAAVIAVDADPDACGRATAAARRFGVQLQVVNGRAPYALEDLPEPDVVRIGGGGVAVVSACADRRPERIVTHASTRDEAEAIGRALAAGGYTVECALLQSVELDTTAWSERDRSVVFLLSGVQERREASR